MSEYVYLCWLRIESINISASILSINPMRSQEKPTHSNQNILASRPKQSSPRNTGEAPLEHLAPLPGLRVCPLSSIYWLVN